MERKSLIALAICGLVPAAASLAQDLGPRDDLLSFAAFGTGGVVHSDERQADFARSMIIPRGAGYSSAWSADVDTLLGGQVTLTATPKLSAVVQVVAEHGWDNSYRPHVEWANVK